MFRSLRYLLPSLLFFYAIIVDGQTLSLYDVDPSAYPLIRANVLALDADGNPYRPNIIDLELFEDGTKRTIRRLHCPEPKPIVPISSVLTLDISSSMREHADRNLETARAAAHAWIESMPLGISECAITSFNLISFLNQDFTIDSRRLQTAIDELQPKGGTSYDAALISPVTGAISVALKGKYKRVIVFLTDGRGNGNEAEIVRQANAGDITIHCVTVGLPAPPILKNVARRTGGLWFENVTSPKEAAEIYRLILDQAQGGEPCEIEWESGPTCDSNRTVTLTDQTLPAEATTTYIAPPQAIADLTVNTIEIAFRTVAPGSTDRQTITLSTGNAPVQVLSITSSDPHIKAVANGAPPAYTIPPNAAYDVIFEFAPTDSSFVYAEITIQIDGCTKTVYAAGGRWGNGSVTPEIRLVLPNGGERFPVGSNRTIRWTGVLPTDTVRLDYSTDAGTTWTTITDKGTGLSYDWHVPNTPSQHCLARVTIDSFNLGNGGSPFAKRLHTYRGHESFGQITAARFSPDGEYVATASNSITDNVRVWKTESGQPYRTFSPTGAVFDLEFSPDGKFLAAAINDNTWKMWDVSSGNPVDEQPNEDIQVIAFSKPGGTLLVTGTSRGEITIWNATNSAMLRSFQTDVGLISSIDFSPKFNEFVVAGSKDTFKIYTTDGREKSKLPDGVNPNQSHSLGVSSARYSDDGNRIVSAGNDGSPRLWRESAREPTYTLSGHNDAAFSPDGSLIVTGEGDLLWSKGDTPGKGRIWEAATGDMLGVLDDPNNGHTKAITSVDITQLNGRSYIVTAGHDSTAIIWELSGEDSTSIGSGVDVSDDLWAIVDAGVEAFNVDFGQVLVGSSKDSVLVGYLRNSGGVEIEVNELQITGRDASAFDIISGLPPFTIPARKSREVELRFTPDAVRRFDAKLKILSTIDTLDPSLSGQGVTPQLRIDATIVDFGLVEVGNQNDTLVQVVISNVGTLPLAITIKQNGPDLRSFFILSGEAPFTLAPDTSHAMSLRFAPVSLGRTSGTIEFGHNGPGSPATVILFGEGFCPTTITRVLASVGDIAGAPGDTVMLPFSIVSLDPPPPSQSGTPLGPLDFIAQFAFNKSILTPVNRAAIVEEGPLERVAAWEGRWDPFDSSITWMNGEPQLVAGLGNAESTPAVIEDITWSQGCPPEVAKSDGIFVLHRLCRDGETRLFSADGQLKLGGITPNPALSEATIRFALIEEGETRLYLVDMKGERVATVVDHVMIPGSYSAILDISGFDRGNYIVVLETPTAQLSEKLIVRE